MKTTPVAAVLLARHTCIVRHLTASQEYKQNSIIYHIHTIFINYAENHVLVLMWFCGSLGDCAIQGDMLIPEDPATELCVCDLKWAEINLELLHIILLGPEMAALPHPGGLCVRIHI